MQLAEEAWGGYAEDTSEVCAPTLAREISPPDRRISWSRDAWIRTVTGGARTASPQLIDSAEASRRTARVQEVSAGRSVGRH